MRYKTILFDLDGTLSNSYEGITKGYQHALKYFGVDAPQEQLRKIIGPTMHEGLIDIWGIPKDRLDEAIAKYREYFTVKGIFEHEIYEGAAEMIIDLAENGARLVLASSKPLVFVEQVLKSYGIGQYFSLIVGSGLDGTLNEKTDIINYIIEQLEISDKSTVVMVGDRKYDLIGAEQAGIDAIGVLYGFAEENELESYPSIFLAKTVKALHEFLRNPNIT